MTCPFCEILETKRERIIRETPHVFAVLSSPRLMPGHMLVIPRRHTEKLSELNEEERKELFDTAIAIEERILAEFASGCDITQHYRPFISPSRLKVNHLHVHLRPRAFEDQLYQTSQKFEVFEDLSPEEAERCAQLLNG